MWKNTKVNFFFVPALYKATRTTASNEINKLQKLNARKIEINRTHYSWTKGTFFHLISRNNKCGIIVTPLNSRIWLKRLVKSHLFFQFWEEVLDIFCFIIIIWSYCLFCSGPLPCVVLKLSVSCFNSVVVYRLTSLLRLDLWNCETESKISLVLFLESFLSVFTPILRIFLNILKHNKWTYKSIYRVSLSIWSMWRKF